MKYFFNKFIFVESMTCFLHDLSSLTSHNERLYTGLSSVRCDLNFINSIFLNIIKYKKYINLKQIL